jgi:hypothetical protein
MTEPTAPAELFQLLARAETLARRLNDPMLSVLLRRAVIRAMLCPEHSRPQGRSGPH